MKRQQLHDQIKALFEGMDALWPVAAKRIEEATGREADEEDIEEALEPIAQATAAKLVLAYQCHDELVKALEHADETLERLHAYRDRHNVWDVNMDLCWDDVRAALAQARGQEAPHV